MSQVVAGPEPPTVPSRRRRTMIKDLAEVIAIALVLYFAISFAFQVIRVDGTSMQGTLQTEDLLLATKIAYHLHDPERGDIVILKPPDAADAGKDFIKRVVAIPGDTVEFDGSYISGPGAIPTAAILIKPAGSADWHRLSEPYLPDPWTSGTFCCQSGASLGMYSPDNRPHPVTIPRADYLVLGDNRNQSKDSRYIGLIPRDNILSKAWIRLQPLGKFGGLGDGPTLLAAAATGSTGVIPVPGAAVVLGVPASIPLAWRRRRARRHGARGARGARPGAADPVTR